VRSRPESANERTNLAVAALAGEPLRGGCRPDHELGVVSSASTWPRWWVSPNTTWAGLRLDEVPDAAGVVVAGYHDGAGVAG
jgi:hypothetical protein